MDQIVIRPKRPSLAITRPIPLIKIIFTICLKNEKRNENSAKGLWKINANLEPSELYCYKTYKIILPAYSSVVSVKEAIIKFEPSYSSLKPRQITTCLPGSLDDLYLNTDKICILDSESDNTKLVEYNQVCKNRFEKNLPILMLFWESSMPKPLDAFKILDKMGKKDELKSNESENNKSKESKKSQESENSQESQESENKKLDNPPFLNHFVKLTSEILLDSDNSKDISNERHISDEKEYTMDLESVKNDNFLRFSELFEKKHLWLNPNILKEGFLLKKMKYSQKKEARWFKLRTDHNLYYYKNKKDQIPLGKIPLGICQINLEANNKLDSFELAYSTRTIKIYNQDETEILSWIEILQRVMTDAKDTYCSQITLDGYLLKFGTGFKNWKRKWFVLKDGYLFYYEHAEKAIVSNTIEYECKINLSNTLCSKLDQQDFCFQIKTEKKTYILMAADQNDLQRWINAINDQRDNLKEAEHFNLNSTNETHSSKNKFKDYDWESVASVYKIISIVTKDVVTDYRVSKHVCLDLISSNMDIDQLRMFRYHYALLRAQIVEQKNRLHIYDVLLAPTTFSPLTKYFPQNLHVRFFINSFSAAVKCPGHSRLVDAIKQALDILNKRKLLEDLKCQDLVVKICGRRQYLFNLQTPIQDIIYVREQVTKKKQFIQFVLKQKNLFIDQIESCVQDPVLVEDQYNRQSFRIGRLSVLKNFNLFFNRVHRQDNNLTTIDPKQDGVFKNSTKTILESNDKYLDISQIRDHYFSLRILSLTNFSTNLFESFVYEAMIDKKPEINIAFFIEVLLFYGDQIINTPMRTVSRITPFWAETLVSNIEYCNLPPETRMGFTLYWTYMSKESPIAWLNIPLTDYTGCLRSGLYDSSMWVQDKKAQPVGSCDFDLEKKLILSLEFEKPSLPITYPRFSYLQHTNQIEKLQKLTKPLYSPFTSFATKQETTIKKIGRKRSVKVRTSSNLNLSADHINNNNSLKASLKNNVESSQISFKSTNQQNTKMNVQLEEIERLVEQDPLSELNSKEKQLIWGYRIFLKSKPKYFPKLFLSADFLDQNQRREVELILLEAPLMPAEMALQLLDFRYADFNIRNYAVRCLETLNDQELCLYSLQLVQVLQYEPFYISTLSSFLLERAILNPLLVGHKIFWHLQAELYKPEINVKFAIFLEAFLLGISQSLRLDFLNQIDLVYSLENLNEGLSDIPLASKTPYLQKQISQTFQHKNFVLPLSSSLAVKQITIESCKVMDSAAFPLWLTFENEDAYAEPISLLYKFGDDVRQDALTLQMFQIMDHEWKNHGFDLQMSIYNCVPTGNNTGMIEIVSDSETTAKIQKESGGIIGAFKQTPLHNWLKNHNSDPLMWIQVVDTFTRSCAAYCVATYVLGIGDRHNDNIMITTSGNLFHIDFSHFLGNIMKFGAYKREKAPFVLTPEFAFVMGGEKSTQFAKFRSISCDIYNIIRRKSTMLISLFELMLFSGLTQLNSHKDLEYLKKSLLTSTINEDESSAIFQKLIDESLSTKSTQLNFAIHIFAHPD